MAANLEEIEQMRDYHPLMVEGVKENHIFTYLGRVDKDSTIFVDATGTFPLRSIDGMTTILIIYDWTSNEILAIPIENTKDETMVRVFREQIEYLSKRGFKPTFHIIDNKRLGSNWSNPTTTGSTQQNEQFRPLKIYSFLAWRPATSISRPSCGVD